MSNNKVIEIKNPELKSNDLLTDLIRGSAREMLAHAIELELRVPARFVRKYNTRI